MNDIDDLIHTWQQRLQAITVNANALGDAESTKRISIRVREGAYKGVTRQRAQQAVEQLTRLVDDYLLLARVVDQAVQASNVGLFGSRENADARVLALLQGPSIERAQKDVPLAQRGLLAAAQQQSHLTPEQLLECMQSDFAQARDTFAAIDLAQARDEAAFHALRQDFDRVRERADRLQPGVEQPPLIAPLDVQADPLNAESGLASMRRSVKAWAESLDAVEHSVEQARAAVDQARGALQALQRLDGELQGLRSSQQPWVRTLAAVQPERAAQTSVQTVSRLDLLHSWCETLDTSLAARHWAAVSVGAKRLQAALAEAQADVQKALAQWRLQRDALDELSGQFTALQAKEYAVRTGGMEDGALQVLRERIAASLQQRPPQPDAIGALLQQYRALLGSAHKV